MEEKSIKYTRVSTILEPFSDFKNINPQVLQNACDRGTKVHKICEGIMLGLGEYDVSEDIKGYIDSFNHWWGEGKEVLHVERRFWCNKYFITGQVDLVMNTEEGLVIVDLKTSAKSSKTWPIQGSAYHYLASKAGLHINKILFVQLRKNGKPPKIHEYKPDIDFFLSIYNVYKYFFHKENENGKLTSGEITHTV